MAAQVCLAAVVAAVLVVTVWAWPVEQVVWPLAPALMVSLAHLAQAVPPVPAVLAVELPAVRGGLVAATQVVAAVALAA